MSCTCSTTDLGQPAGVIRWTGTGTSQLSLSNVNKTQDGQQFTCEVMWNGQRVQSVVYTLHVACKFLSLDCHSEKIARDDLIVDVFFIVHGYECHPCLISIDSKA